MISFSLPTDAQDDEFRLLYRRNPEVADQQSLFKVVLEVMVEQSHLTKNVFSWVFPISPPLRHISVRKCGAEPAIL